jgi:chemotaxis protein CheC
VPDSQPTELATIAIVAASAVQSAANALSEMALREITAVSPEIRMVDLTHLSMVAGDPERAVVAVYLGIQGDIQGHILMAFSESMALGLVDMLMARMKAPRPSLTTWQSRRWPRQATWPARSS